VPANHL